MRKRCLDESGFRRPRQTESGCIPGSGGPGRPPLLSVPTSLEGLAKTAVVAALAGLALAASLPAAETGAATPGAKPAKPAQGTGANRKTEPAFPVVDEVEKREKELKERRFKQKRLHQFNDIQRLVQLALLQQDADERIRKLLRAESLLRKMLTEKPEAKLAQAIRQVQNAIMQVPPPTVFRDRVGLEMTLVDRPAAPFYASSTPVNQETFAAFLAETGAKPVADAPAEPGTGDGTPRPVTGITWTAADGFCKWLNQKVGSVYSLPTLQQLRLLRLQPRRAFWTSALWEGPTEEARKTRARYGVPMYSIFDPDKTIADREVLADLPFVRYDTLGFFVVTTVESGVNYRLKRLRSEK